MAKMKFCVVFNTESAFWYEKDQEFREFVDRSDFQICDGAPLALAARLKGVALPRYHGPDLMRDILLDPTFQRVYLLGGSPRAHEKIISEYSLENRKITGDTSFYSDELSELAIEMIKEASPDVIFVCLGLRKQERIAAHIVDQLPDIDSLIVGVGASVDFLGGTKVRSHSFFQHVGLEWLPRMIREPRMFVRNFRALRSLPMVLAGKVGIIHTGHFAEDLKAVTAYLGK